MSTYIMGPDIAEEQFGFRIGRSTIDAVDRVVTTAQATIAQGGMALAVSVDIVNLTPFHGARSAKHSLHPEFSDTVLGTSFPATYQIDK